MTNDADLPVVHNIAAKRFEIGLDGKIAFSKYLLVGEKMIIEHTEVPAELEGKGIAGRIVRTALDYARRSSRSCRCVRSPPASSIVTPSTRTWCWKVTGTERCTAPDLTHRQWPDNGPWRIAGPAA